MRRVPPSTPLQPPVFFLELQFVLSGALAALISTVTNSRTEFANSGVVPRTEVFLDPIIIPIGHAAPEMRQDVITPVDVDGLGVGLHETSAEAARIRFSDDSEEPSCGRLYAAQELVRAMGTAAVFVVAATSAHCCLHQAGSYERCLAVVRVWRVGCVVQLRREECGPLSPRRAVLAKVGARPR